MSTFFDAWSRIFDAWLAFVPPKEAAFFADRMIDRSPGARIARIAEGRAPLVQETAKADRIRAERCAWFAWCPEKFARSWDQSTPSERKAARMALEALHVRMRELRSQGVTFQEIADVLCVSIRTVQKHAKGVGPSVRQPKLSHAQIEELRERAAKGESDAELAAAFGVSVGYVKGVRIGLSFPNVPGPITRRSPWEGRRKRARVPTLTSMSEERGDVPEATEPGIPAQKRKHRQSKLSSDQIRELRERAATGESDADLAAAFELSAKYVNAIRTGGQLKNAPGPITLKRAARKILTAATVARIRELYTVPEMRRADIARETGTSVGTVLRHTRDLPRRKGAKAEEPRPELDEATVLAEAARVVEEIKAKHAADGAAPTL